MPSTKLTLVVGVLVILIVLIIYYANRTTIPPNHCVETVKCKDVWVDSESGTTIDGVVKRCINGEYVSPGYGPDQCTDPCGPGRTACWDAKNKQGVCYPGVGFACPCLDDKDCNGPNQGSCVNNACVCKPGWSGPTCGVKSGGAPCSDSKTCGPNGTCVDNVCVCKTGWDDNIASGVPCSICAPNWGPSVGDLNYPPAAYCSGNLYTGITVPVPVGHSDGAGSVTECGSNANLDLKCKAAFGPSFGATGATDTGICSNCSLGGSYVAGCTSPSGIWASPTFNAAKYNPWAYSSCQIDLPDGFVMPLH